MTFATHPILINLYMTWLSPYFSLYNRFFEKAGQKIKYLEGSCSFLNQQNLLVKDKRCKMWLQTISGK